MRKIIILMGALFFVCDTDGMLQVQSFPLYSSFSERNLDALPGYSLWQEQWEVQRKRDMLSDEIKQKMEGVRLDKPSLLANVNGVVKDVFTDLLDRVLNGDVDSLNLLSERIYSGRLMNKLIFVSEVNLTRRKEIIFEISLELFRKTGEVVKFLENVGKFCPEKLKTLDTVF